MQIAFAKVVGVGVVGQIDDEHVEKIFVGLRDTSDGAGPAFAAHQKSGGTGDGIATDDRADSHDGRRGVAQCFANAGHGKDRAHAGDWVARRKNHGLGGGDAFEHTRRRTRFLRALEVNAAHFNLVTLANKIFLKVQGAVRRVHHGCDAVVRHRKDAGTNLHATGQVGGDVAERQTFAQQIGASQVSGQVKVAQAEPRGLAEARHALKAAKAIVFNAPAALDAQRIGQRIKNGIDVGRDMQSPPLDVVASIDDDSEVLGRDNVVQALHQLRSPGSA